MASGKVRRHLCWWPLIFILVKFLLFCVKFGESNGEKAEFPGQKGLLFTLADSNFCEMGLIGINYRFNCFYVGILCQVLFSKLYILTSAHLQMLLLATA
jgi:hypothetical protein